MDNDNYRDWKQQLRDEACRAWLERYQDLLHMRYYFDSGVGFFETLDGNVPPGLLANVGFNELDFKELDFKELGVLGYLMGVPI
jgi:hypothetical protein